MSRINLSKAQRQKHFLFISKLLMHPVGHALPHPPPYKTTLNHQSIIQFTMFP
jgi:hypothetical protein